MKTEMNPQIKVSASDGDVWYRTLDSIELTEEEKTRLLSGHTVEVQVELHRPPFKMVKLTHQPSVRK